MYLEGGDLLRLTGDALLRFGLQVGMDLSAEDVVKLKEAQRHCRVRSQGAGFHPVLLAELGLRPDRRRSAGQGSCQARSYC